MSTNGIKTSFWGPHAWAFLFSSIAGSYPVRIDPANKEHLKISRAYQQMFGALQYTLPCSFCRQSYGIFTKELPIANFAGSRKEMVKWLYLIHDKVNKKLIKQEAECYDAQKAILIKKNIKPDKLRVMLKELRTTIMITKPSPPFERVLAKYERQRAGCSKKTKKCT